MTLWSGRSPKQQKKKKEDSWEFFGAPQVTLKKLRF